MQLKKINTSNQPNLPNHNGWHQAIHALSSLYHPKGVYFDTFLEETFFWKKSHETYLFPWIGVIHHPPYMPKWRYSHETLEALLTNPYLVNSLANCKGIFTLSEYTAAYIRDNTNLTVSTLLHPIAHATKPFRFEQFKANPSKKIIQLGFFLRKVSAIYRLPLVQNNPLKLSKIALIPNAITISDYRLFVMEEIARNSQIIDARYLANTHEVYHINRADYETWLSENIAFIEFFDTSANNAVLECIAAATPLLVNPLPAVKEYLGEDYPLYYDSLEQAAAMACDENLLYQAHLYLKNSPIREKITFDYFLESFKRSEVYQRL